MSQPTSEQFTARFVTLLPILMNFMPNSLTLSQKAHVCTCLQIKSFENTVRKGEMARNEQFLIFPQCFLLSENFTPFPSNLELSSANSFSYEESKICHLGKG